MKKLLSVLLAFLLPLVLVNAATDSGGDYNVTADGAENGDLTVAGDTALSGNLDVMGDYIDFGTAAANSGVTFNYVDDATVNVGTLEVSMTRPNAAWLWKAAAGTATQMQLSPANTLTLFDHTNVANVIEFNPVAGTITIGGEEVLTEGSAGSLYDSAGNEIVTVNEYGTIWTNNGTITVSSNAINSAFFGSGHTAHGGSSITAGTNNEVLGSQSASFGQNNKSHGAWSFSAGRYTNALGHRSVALGGHNYASADDTIAMGFGAIAHAEGSLALGSGVYTQGFQQTAIGRYNIASGDWTQWDNTDLAFIIGNGTDGQNRSNAFTVSWQGDTWVAGSLAVGNLGASVDIVDTGDIYTSGVRIHTGSVSGGDHVVNVGDSFGGAAGVGGGRVVIGQWSAERGAQLSLGGNVAIDGGRLGSVTFVNKQAADPGRYSSAEIAIFASGTSREGADIVFSTNETATTSYPTERVRIKANGDTLVSGDIDMATGKRIRIDPVGDISMGDFTN